MNFFRPKNDQNLSFLKHHVFVLTSLVRGLHTLGSITVPIFYDLRVSLIEKIIFKYCPKFLDLYANIYGSNWLRPGAGNYFRSRVTVRHYLCLAGHISVIKGYFQAKNWTPRAGCGSFWLRRRLEEACDIYAEGRTLLYNRLGLN